MWGDASALQHAQHFNVVTINPSLVSQGRAKIGHNHALKASLHKKKGRTDQVRPF